MQGCGSGSVWFWASQSGSFSQGYQAKIVWKTLISTVLWLLYDFLSFKNDVSSKGNKQKNLPSWRLLMKIAGSGSGSQRHGSGSVPKCQGSATLETCYKKRITLHPAGLESFFPGVKLIPFFSSSKVDSTAWYSQKYEHLPRLSLISVSCGASRLLFQYRYIFPRIPVLLYIF